MSNEEIKERVRQIITDKLGVHEDEVCPAAHLMEDLGADSLDTVELIMEFEKQFDIKISDERSDKIKTVGDINEAIIELTEQQ